ncbi:electron transport complex subunit RsxA [Candidatus Erwinia haradaeae]|uniref:Ion-translocating oxidoreductase complex subunit A n=1 Tax=Candidatus Erwinia haradaeae TaxID=1922217 RepID=A0A803FSU9_9GAMM|nr:electron transport complex subunit RsxA [Candidatus Erwinia haradaeae]VFP87165.1 Ion-translocating oxidoreductase complex subunitA [Candidatus Erwinia haradaeae]
MTKYLLLFISTVLMNNFVLVKFLGLCPFMGVSKKLESAIGMGLATTFVITISSILSWLVNHIILIPLNLHYLRTITYILIIASVVQFTEMLVHKTSPTLYRVLGIFLPLITTNCSVLGVPLLSMNFHHGFMESTIYGFSASISFLLIIVLFSSIREHIICSDIPEPFKGSSITLITAGLMSMAFMGFSGLVKS